MLLRTCLLLTALMMLASCATTATSAGGVPDENADPHVLIAGVFAASGYSKRDANALADRALRRFDGGTVKPFVRRDPVREDAIILDPDTDAFMALDEAFRLAGHPPQRAADLATVMLRRRQGITITVEDLENRRKELGLE